MTEQPEIYALRRRNDSEYRYVGQTMFGARYRFDGHLKTARYGKLKYPVYDWINAHNGMIAYDVLESIELNAPNILDFREQFWIAALRESGHRLLNIGDGGAVPRGYRHTDEWKQELSNRMTGDGNHMYGRQIVHTDEWKQELSRRMSGEGNHMYGRRGVDAPCYGRTGEAHPMFGKHHTDEAKRKIAESSLGRKHSEETREKMRLAQQQRAASGELSEKAKKAMHIRWHVNRSIINPACIFCSE